MASDDYEDLVQAIEDAVLTSPGAMSVEDRRQIFDGENLAGLEPYLEKLRKHAYKIVDGDVEALREAGRSEDEIFEITLSGALGAGLSRWRTAMDAMRAAKGGK
jgi:alkylhydroperoxidase family enzyme